MPPKRFLRNPASLLAVTTLLIALCGCAFMLPPPADADPTAVPTPAPTPVPAPSPTPVPTPTPVPYPARSVTGPLEPGMQDGEVIVAQEMLRALGFAAPLTGEYDCRTRNAVRAFQRYAGLTPDGLLSAECCAELTRLYDAARGTAVRRAPLPLEGYVVCLDAGHQRRADSAPEPVSPGSSTMKKKVSGGARGVVTKLYEYELNLIVALKVRDLLADAGAEVVMVRETHDVHISNAERAQLANDVRAHIALRIHANGSKDPGKSGMYMLVPAVRGHMTEELAAASREAAEYVLEATLEATGAKGRGYAVRGDLTGFNWSKVPVCLIEMGYMTNAEEDRLMATGEYQDKLAQGIARGIADYLMSCPGS